MTLAKTRAVSPGRGKRAEDSARDSGFQLGACSVRCPQRIFGSSVAPEYPNSPRSPQARRAQCVYTDEIIVRPTACEMLQLRGRAIAPLSKKEKSREQALSRSRYLIAEI